MTDYALLAKQVESLGTDEECWVSYLANVSALLAEALDRLNWVGFYLVDDDRLVLGPFQGRVACSRIGLGSGVCGTAAALDETQVVPDVDAFPGHIACDGRSRSELVVPVHAGGKVVAVLDIDSPELDRFAPDDVTGIEAVVSRIETGPLPGGSL